MKILILFSLALCLCVVESLDNNDINMIVSFATLDERATSILTPYVCWSAYELTSLAKNLRDAGISTATSLQPNRPEFFLQNLLILADLRCRGTHDFFIKASDEGFLKSPYRWLLLSQDPEELANLDRLAMLVDSDVVIARKRGKEYQYIEVYKISENSQLIYSTRALWRPIDKNTRNKTNTAITYYNKSKAVVNRYGIVEDYRKTKILAVRRMDIRKHTLTMVNVITDSNDTRKHMDDRFAWYITFLPYQQSRLVEPKEMGRACIARMFRYRRVPNIHLLRTDRDPLGSPGVCEIPSHCGKARLLEHIRSVKKMDQMDVRNSAVAEHACDTGASHFIRFDKASTGGGSDSSDTAAKTLTLKKNSRRVRKMSPVVTFNTNLHQDSITKMSYMVVKICFEMMNSTEKLLFTNTWGYVDKNGSWNGIVERLLKKEGDIGTLTIFTQERMQMIDYIAMVGTTAVRFVFREPPLAYVSNIFALPFTGAVWLAIFVCVLGCALFLYITSKWEATMGMHPLQLDGSWADVLILIIGAVLQQGCTLEPRHAAGRVVTLILFIALTTLYAAYSANIVVLLRAPSSSVRSLQDILNSPLKLGASDFAYNRYFFRKLNEPLRKEIYNKKIAPKGKRPNFYTMKEGVEKIRKGLFAFHMELNPGYRLIQETYKEDEKCDLVEIDFINERDPWVPGQKRSPYKDLFKINFIKIRESGIQACIHQRLHVGRPRCLGAVNTFSSVGIMDMYSAMLATLYGMLMAPAVLLLEIAYKRLMVAREKRRMMRSID